jgi:hypothetical protein
MTRIVISGTDMDTPRHQDKTHQDDQPAPMRQRVKDWQARIAAQGGTPGEVKISPRLKERQAEYDRIPITKRKGFRMPGSQQRGK